MTTPRTEALITEMVAHARNGHDVIPAFFQPVVGRSNHVSAAIRTAVKRGLLVQNGVDGTGKPKYAAVVPSATHASTTSIH
jgi:hypothetical protein